MQEPPAETPPARPQNVVLILADDLGIGDVCAYGCPEGRATPHIDSLARDGVRFTHAYSTSPVCSPSRAAVLTGRYQQRFGHEFNPDGIERGHRESLGLPAGETLLPSYLEQRGYVSGVVGKWHLGPHQAQHPLARGFDEFFGFLHGAKIYFPSIDEPGIHLVVEPAKQGKEKIEHHPLNPLLRGREPVREAAYLTDAFTREAVAFIERHRDQPFFLYLPYNAPHTPLQVDDARYDRFPSIADEGQRIHAAMMAALDDGVGAILAALRRAGIADDTLVIFASDHGCPTNTGVCSNRDLLGGKRVLLEGGIRIPLLAAGGGRVEPGRVVDEPVSLLDVVPTVLELAGVPASSRRGGGAHAALDRELDGKSLLPLLRGEEGARGHDSLFWRHGPNWAVRHGRWKLAHFAGQPPLLFDLAARGERADLAAEHADVVADLTHRYQTWAAEMIEPAWPNGGSIWASLQDLLAGKPIRPLSAPAAGAVELP